MTSENIHVRSFREFVQRRLPEALAKVIPLNDYRAEWTSESRGRISFSVSPDGPRLTFDDLLFPRPDGSYLPRIGEHPLFVIMTASSNNLEEAQIRLVGDQLMDHIAPHLAPPPNGGPWDEAMLRAWFPLDQWLESIWGGGIPTAQWMDLTNRVAQATHFRRVFLLGGPYSARFGRLGNDQLSGGDASFHPSQVGRVDPLETPEGPNTGRVFTLARGAEVRDGRIVPAPDRAESTLGLANSLVPLLCHNDPMRQLQGGNMIRQAVLQDEREAPLVRSGLEPEDGSSFLGRNLLTAFMHWKGMTYEDAIVLSESAAKRLGSAPWVAEVGDKLSNRHGAKGVVGAVLRDEEMPHLPDGRAVDLIFDANSVYSRLNFGQILEAPLGLVAQARGQAITMAPFRRTTPEELHGLLREAGLPESGQLILRDGKEGAELDEPTTVGYVYWYRLEHEVRTKIHAFAPKWQDGAGQAGGSRIGAMEVAALRAVGAYENILEAVSTRAQGAEDQGEAEWALPMPDVEAHKWFVQRVGGGFIGEHAVPPSPAFRRVQRALRVGGIEMEFTGDTVHFRPAEAGDLPLAQPMPHPWRPGTTLTHISPPVSHAETYERVTNANTRLAEALASGAADAARAGLQKAVSDLLDEVREDCRVSFGERSQFTGRSVLAPGYDLRISQLGLPEDIAYPLFSPLIADRLGWGSVQGRFDRAKRHIDALMRESVVILNRAPTWEVTNITAFTPVMVPGRSILLHPLCCRMFNADFDGDQAAVWLPITKMAQAEAKEKLTVLAHLKRDPSVMAGHLTPGGGIMMGLAYALDFPEGREQFAALWPASAEAPTAPLTRDLLVARLLAALDKIGPEALLELLEGLYRMGIRWATRSGASLSPFVGEGLKLPPPPTSDYAASWHQYAGIVEAEIPAQGDSDPTLRAPLRAIRCGARGSLRHLRALVGPWAGDSPYAPGPVKHGFRDGLEPDEYWIVTERARRNLLEIDRQQSEVAAASHEAAARRLASGEASVLRRAMAARDPAAVFAEAAELGQTDPLTDTDVRLWMGMRPLEAD
ncbi:MAG: hypothetical protein ACE149_13200 [Armatimonadota bacterium]